MRQLYLWERLCDIIQLLPQGERPKPTSVSDHSTSIEQLSFCDYRLEFQACQLKVRTFAILQEDFDKHTAYYMTWDITNEYAHSQLEIWDKNAIFASSDHDYLCCLDRLSCVACPSVINGIFHLWNLKRGPMVTNHTQLSVQCSPILQDQNPS